MAEEILYTQRFFNGSDYDILYPKTVVEQVQGAIAVSQKGTANGVASLGVDGKVPSTQLPPYTNRNLLDNPWFTINQRGQSSYGGSKYTVDRWFTGGYPQTISVDSNGVTIVGSPWLEQYLPKDTSIIGKTMTASILLQDGSVISGSNVIADGRNIFFRFVLDGIEIYVDLVLEFSHDTFRIVNFEGLTSITLALRAVKLELGSVSTLINDIAPDYQTELLKCQRYQFLLGGNNIAIGDSVAAAGTKISNTATYFTIPLTTPLYKGTALPLLEYSADDWQILYNGSNYVITDIAVHDVTENAITLAVTHSSTTSYYSQSLVAKTAGAKILITSNL